MTHFLQVLKEETSNFHLRIQLVRFLLFWLPPYTGVRLRTTMYRFAGFSIRRGTIFMGNPTFTGSGSIEPRLTIGEMCILNIGVLINLGADVIIEDGVALGHEVMILTESHLIGPSAQRAGEITAKPVHIGKGAWIGARSIIQPGVYIGAGAIVAPGAVVSKDVPPDTFVGGVPASFIKELEK